MAMELEYDKSLLGKEFKAGPFQVTAELIRDYCSSIGESNPVYTDEAAAKEAGYPDIIAPPVMTTIFIRGENFPDIKLKFGRMRFHASQTVQPVSPLVAGDSLMASSALKEVYPKTGRSGTMVFIVWETTFTNQRGEAVAAVQESFAARE